MSSRYPHRDRITCAGNPEVNDAELLKRPGAGIANSTYGRGARRNIQLALMEAEQWTVRFLVAARQKTANFHCPFDACNNPLARPARERAKSSENDPAGSFCFPVRSGEK
jgi:hypothetical protein